MARTKQTARKATGGKLPRKSPAGKVATKKATVKVARVEEITTSDGEDVIVITENLEKLKLPQLNKILEEYGISKSDIHGSGKGGNVLKSDIILAIKDHDAKKHKGDSIELKPKKAAKGKANKSSSPPKKTSKKTASPVKKTAKKTKSPAKKNSPPKKVVKDTIVIVSAPKGMRIPSVDKLTAVQTLEALKKYKEYSKLSDYEIKKKIGGGTVAKVADLRHALRVLMDDIEPPKKVSKSPPKKVSKSKTPSPPKKAKKAKTPSPPKKKPVKGVKPKSPKKGSLKCEDRDLFKDKYCDTTTGKIITKTKDGNPRGLKALKERMGDDVYIDKDFGLIGTKEDVQAHIDHWNKVRGNTQVSKSPDVKMPPKVKKPKSPPKRVSNSPNVKLPPKEKAKKLKSPPKRVSTSPNVKLPPKEKAKKPKSQPKEKARKPPKKEDRPVKPTKPISVKRACAAANMESVGDYDECEKGEVCSVLTGKCVADNVRNRSGQSTLIVEGRSIIGDRETLEKLQKRLGGEISVYTTKSVEKRESPVARTKKTSGSKSTAKDGAHIAMTDKGVITEKRTDGTVVTATREDIHRTFTECLARLK